jgi:ABC-type dipeptide/oligopeptide/nickel transport system permease component
MPIAYLLRRIALAGPTLLGVALFVFVLIRIAPGDPIAMMVTGEATPEDIARLRAVYGLDHSIPVQFLIFLRDLATGHFGTSISLHQDVLSLVFERLPATLELAVTAMLLSVACGLTFALVSVYWRGRWPAAVVDAIAAAALAVPEFLWALLLILLFGVAIPWLPISGRIEPENIAEFHTQFYLVESVLTGRFALAGEVLAHLVLPALALALPLTAVIARVLKSSLLQAADQEYVLLARAKGFSPGYVLWHHLLPNALIPAVTISGVHFTLLLGGTVLVELIFSYPGIGNMLYGAAINRDLPLIQGITIVFAVMFILMNILIDCSYALMNPRVRQG